MSKVEAMDLGFNGPLFTWRGMRNEQLVEARLDQGLVNRHWQPLWPNTIATYGTVLRFDNFLVPNEVKKEKKNRFEAFWAKEYDCREVVKGSWKVR